MSTIVNSTVANTLFDTAGNPITASNQPDLNKTSFVAGTLSNSRANSAPLASSVVAKDVVQGVYPQNVTLVTTTINSAAVGGSTITFTYASSVASLISPLDLVLTSQGYLVKVLDVTTSGTVVILNATDSSLFASPLTSEDLATFNQNSVSSDSEGQYIGSADAILKSGATTPNRSVNKAEVIRTRKTATFMRSNQWDPINGEWGLTPSISDDTVATNIANDNVNKISYQFGGPTPTGTTV